MIELQMPVIVPENRKVTLTLPPEVPTGPMQLTVRLDASETPPIEVKLDPALLPKRERSGLVREIRNQQRP
jgi:hypothetical protein